VAYCLEKGWDQNHPFIGIGSVNEATCAKRALAMYVKTDKETKRYHWAQFELASLYFYGIGTDQDYTKAVEWFTKASAQGYGLAMHNLGNYYAIGKGCEQDCTTAFKWFAKASAQEHSGAMYNLGLCWQHG
jgi:TPR repeat protein